MKFSSTQKFATAVADIENGFTVAVAHKEGNVSQTYTHTYGEDPDFDKMLIQRGVVASLKAAYAGFTDATAGLENANKTISALSEGRVLARGSVNTSSKEPNYLVKAVLRLNLVESETAWYALSLEDRAALRTPEVNAVAEALRIKAKQVEADKILEGGLL